VRNKRVQNQSKYTFYGVELTSERLLNMSVEVLYLPKNFIPPPKKNSGYAPAPVILFQNSRTHVTIIHIRRSWVSFGGAIHFLPENTCIKINKMPQFYMIFARKWLSFTWYWLKMPEFFLWHLPETYFPEISTAACVPLGPRSLTPMCDN